MCGLLQYPELRETSLDGQNASARMSLRNSTKKMFKTEVDPPAQEAAIDNKLNVEEALVKRLERVCAAVSGKCQQLPAER